MSFFLRRLDRLAQNSRSFSLQHVRRISGRIVQEGDIVLLKNIRFGVSQPILTPPLIPGKKIKLQHDSIPHNSIIGQELSTSLICTAKKVQYRIHTPTLAEYTDNSPRMVTPIYSQDASLIVSLLDINPTLPGQDGDKLEIFEAGTGHGALTLFLARAIHAANTAPPIVTDSEDQTQMEEYNQWLSKRRAVINTLDISAAHSAHAQKTIKKFRSGMYFSNINFHTGTIENYLKPRLDTEEPFLDHAILDLPNTHTQIEIVSQAMKTDATMITFCPSITQINECLEFAKEEGLPLFLESVIEIGGQVGVGGKEWDVRRIKLKPVKGTTTLNTGAPDALALDVEEQVSGSSPRDIRPASLHDQSASVEKIQDPIAISESPVVEEQKWDMICRPKVGLRVVGGGFVGLWRKKTS